jgi:hypothetical protein
VLRPVEDHDRFDHYACILAALFDASHLSKFFNDAGKQ